jgi:hypothetical protein
MSPHLTRLLRSITVTSVAVVAFGSLAAAPSQSGGDAGLRVTADDLAPVATVRREREGDCRTGPGEWALKVRRASRHRIRINFSVDEVGQRQRWQVFVGDNGRRILAVTRTTNRSGEFQIERFTRNRRGRDRVAASAVNPRTGAVCNAHLRF